MKQEIINYLDSNVNALSHYDARLIAVGVRNIIDKYDEQLTGTGCAEVIGNGVVGDTCTSLPFDYVAEAKRQALHHMLVAHIEKAGVHNENGAQIAAIVNEAFNELERLPLDDAQELKKSQKSVANLKSVQEQLMAALLTISNIQNALDLPGKKGISEEVIELVEELKARLGERDDWPVLRDPKVSRLLPYQQRVVGELTEMKYKLSKLNEFFAGDVFRAMPEQERIVLESQAHIMSAYVQVLTKRVDSF